MARDNSPMAKTRHASAQTISNLKGDYVNIAFLLLLYVLQGIPIGLSGAVPLLLQNRKVSYSEQALFSFVTWPFSLKLLWAPFVDSVFIKRIGRRKSWLVPTQLGIGLFMLILSRSVTSLMADDPLTGAKPDILLLTSIFLMLNFLAATQDIAVDGWALTMLSRKNVGYASTCNTVGQTAGFFIGNVVFLALESADFCNKYIRSNENQSTLGIVTFEGFLYNCGIIFTIVTILVAILKSESKNQQNSNYHDNEDNELATKLNPRKSFKGSSSKLNDKKGDSSTEEVELGIRETYAKLCKILGLKSFQLLAVILLTCKIGFSAPEAVSGLKLVESGVHKENLALLAVPMVPLQIILPWILSRITCGPRPLDLFLKAFPYRLLFGIIFPLIVYWTTLIKLEDGTFPMYYYFVLIIVYALEQITVYSMFVAIMAFHASVSDPAIGGTYMTLLNTITNLGGNWPSTLSLWLVDKLSFKNCVEVCVPNNMTVVDISTKAQPPTTCSQECTTTFDGYYLECAICVVFGILWLQWGGRKIKRLQSLPSSAWNCR